MSGATSTNNNDTQKVSITRTVLRIKRRRNEDPLPYLRLEGLDGSIKRKRSTDGNSKEDQQLSELMQNNARLQANKNTPPPPPPGPLQKPTRSSNTSAIWKRMRDTESSSQDQMYRVVDAVLEDDLAPTNKRRKLTVLETSSQTELVPNTQAAGKKKKKALKVLDPVTRLVDDSLQEVHQGNKTARQHYTFIKTDPRLAHQFKTWLHWCHSAGGNLLHACAIWNEVELASELLQIDTSLSEAVDGDGKTPYELAQMAGHDSICEVLEAFGGDTSNYVYDIFYLDDAPQQDSQEDDTGIYQENPIATAELTSGVGYWTPFGELVLEAPEKYHASLDHIFDEDGEIDSNCEEYGGNDYPDEEDVVDGDSDDSWAEAFTPDQGFRNHEDDYYAYDAAHDYDDM